jgi:hypothetical protein
MIPRNKEEYRAKQKRQQVHRQRMQKRVEITDASKTQNKQPEFVTERASLSDLNRLFYVGK